MKLTSEPWFAKSESSGNPSTPPKMSPRNEEDMDAKRLASITADAVSNVLFFHTKRITPPADIRRAGLEHAINAVFHLRSRAADTAVAHLEIACDAALSYAHEYNELHPDNTINPRWAYTCVQALLSHRLKPALMEDGKVQRLLHWVAEQKDDTDASATASATAQALASDFPELDEGQTLSSVELLSSSSSSSPGETMGLEVTIAYDNDDDDGDDEDGSSSFIPSARVPAKTRESAKPAVPTKDVKMLWTDADIRRMIELRAQGLTHLETAARLGRGKGAVENKYGRVVKETAWKPFIATCEARYIKVRRGKRKAPLEWDGDEDEDEDDERDHEKVKGPHQQKKKNGAKLAKAAGLE